jgi:hypothetical protein
VNLNKRRRDSLKVCWRRFAERIEETSSKEIDLLSLAFVEAEIHI